MSAMWNVIRKVWEMFGDREGYEGFVRECQERQNQRDRLLLTRPFMEEVQEVHLDYVGWITTAKIQDGAVTTAKIR